MEDLHLSILVVHKIVVVVKFDGRTTKTGEASYP